MSQVEAEEERFSFAFICFLCNKEYDSEAHLPYTVCTRSHTICKVCLDDTLSKDKKDEEDLVCPFCKESNKKTFPLKFTHFKELKEGLNKSRQTKLEKRADTEEMDEEKPSLEQQLNKQKEKTKWLLQYCFEIDRKYQELSVNKKKKDDEIQKKIGKYQQSLEKLSKQFWRVRGDHQFEQENYEKIIEFSQHIIKNSPKYDYNSHGFGNVQDQIGLFEVDPVKWYCKARSDHNFSSSPYDILSLAYLITNNFTEAEQWYSARIAKNHDNYQLMIGLANTEYNLGKYQEAEKLYHRVIELRPDLDKSYQQLAFIKLMKQNNIQQGRKWAQLALKKNAGNVYAQYILATTEEGVDTRIEKLQKLIEHCKTYARAYNGLGRLYNLKKNWEEAIKWYKKAIDINPKYDAPYYGVGIIHYTKGDYDEAIKWFEECVKVNPKYENPLYGLGSAYHKKGSNEQALKWYNKCIQLNPSNSQAHNGAGTIYALMEKYDEAMKHFKKCIEIDPNHQLCYNSLGNVYFYKGDLEKAAQCYEKCIQINPKYGAPYNGLSNVCVKKGKQEEAKKWYERKIEAAK